MCTCMRAAGVRRVRARAPIPCSHTLDTLMLASLARHGTAGPVSNNVIDRARKSCWRQIQILLLGMASSKVGVLVRVRE